MADRIIFVLVSLMYIAVCGEADMYVPAFPQMVRYFGTSEDQIQLVMSINFIGLCFAGLIAGPLSDAFGRRGILTYGLFGFFLSSVACIFTQDFRVLLFCRLIQGICASVPMVVGAALFLDRYTASKASQMVGWINTVITAAMAGAPILGAILSQALGWKANFVVISAVAGIAWLGTVLFIQESLPIEKRNPLKVLSILKDYWTLATSFKFVGYSLICLLPFVGIVVYISNISLIFINHLGVPAGQFGFYQGTTMMTYMVCSGLGAKLIGRKGLVYTRTLGGALAFAGGLFLALTALLCPTSVVAICLSIALFAAGGSFLVGIFGMMALDLFPNMRGTASAMQNSVRQLSAAGMVVLTQVFFDGTIVPVAAVLFGYVCTALLWYLALTYLPAAGLKRHILKRPHTSL